MWLSVPRGWRVVHRCGMAVDEAPANRATEPYRKAMRWDEVLADLEGEFDGALSAQQDEEIRDLAEGEAAQVELVARLRARIGDVIHLRLRNGATVQGDVQDVAASWLLARVEGRDLLVPMHAVVAAWPLHHAAPPATAVEQRVGIGHALRLLARHGEPVVALTAVGEYRGWITRVGRDHLDLATAHPGARSPVGRAVTTLRLEHLITVRSGA